MGASASTRYPEPAAALTVDPSRAVLFAKKVALERLEAERPYTFWVDVHWQRLELGLSLCPHSPLFSSPRHAIW